MTTYANPSNDFRPMSHEMGRVFAHTGHHNGYIAQGASLVSDIDSVGLEPGPHNAFVKTSESGLDVTIDTGEAVVAGAIVGKDNPTTVSLPASSSPTVVVGWDPNVGGSVIIDIATNLSGAQPSIPLYDFTTDTASVTSETDQRPLGEYIDIQNTRYETDDGSSGEQVDDAAHLGGVAPESYSRVDQTETIEGERIFNDRVCINGQIDEPAIHVLGANAIDVDTVVIDGDADADQNDDLLKVRGISNSDTQTATDEDTVFVTQGSGLIGINKHNPQAALDVNGEAHVNGFVASGTANFQNTMDLSSNDINSVGTMRSSTVNSNNVNILEGGNGVQHRVSEGRYFIAPLRSNESTPRYNHELTYHDGAGRWGFETDLDVARGTAVASDTNRRIYVGNSFPSSAQNGDILFVPE
jgi:hypothetical protein